ncbi:TetR/AcrR family transcriptional regulator [Streptomyces sp. NPDC004838]
MLDQVIAYLAANGIAKLSIRKLAEALGVSTSVITHQFGSKETLILEALRRAREANLSRFQSLREARPDASFADAFMQIWDWWVEDPARIAFSRFNIEVMLIEGLVDDAARDDLTTFWLDYWSEWLVRDGMSPEIARVRATLAISVLSGVTVDLVSTGQLDRLNEAVKDFARNLRV